jgi:hypothetical protein
VAPNTPSEQMLANIWQDLFHLESVSVDADFFQLGGHSLMVARLFSRVRSSMGVELSWSSIFEMPRLRQFAALVDAAGGSRTDQAELGMAEGGSL